MSIDSTRQLRLFDPPGRHVDLDDVTDGLRRGYLVPYDGNTKLSYNTDLLMWFEHLASLGVAPLQARRLHVEEYSRQLLDDGKARSTVYRKLVVISGFYRYAEEEDVIAKSPARYVRRPRVPAESQSTFLDRAEIGRFLFAAQNLGPVPHTLVCLLVLNGLRVTEATGACIENLGFADGHRTLSFVGKNAKPATVPLPPRTSRAILLVIGDRHDGPILLNTLGKPMSRHSASKIIAKTTRLADVDKRITPHSLRHSWVTAALDAGVDLRLVQHGARHADSRSTIRYDRTGAQLDKHPAYVVAAFVAGG